MQHHSWGWDINATFNIKMAQHSKGTVFGLHTSEVHFEAPPSSLAQDFVNTKVCFHGADLPTENGKCVESPTFFCLGYEWRLRLYPSGCKKDVENYFPSFSAFVQVVASRRNSDSLSECSSIRQVFINSKLQACSDCGQNQADPRLSPIHPW